MSEQMKPDIGGGEQSQAREALDALNTTNRILVEARMLPEDKPLTQDQMFAVIESFKQYIAKRGITPAQVAREAGYVSSVLSQWQNNTYRGDVDEVTRAVNVWMERHARRSDAKQPKGYVPTWVAETIQSVAFLADRHLMMAAIVAPSGSGKTKVLKILSEKMRGVYLYIAANTTESAFMEELAAGLGYDKSDHRKGVLRRFIVGQLSKTKQIVFLDEAQNLRRAIGAVRSIHDQACVPIVMAGTADVFDMVDDRAQGRGQLSSRTIRCDLLSVLADASNPGRTAKGRKLFSEIEIKQFLASRGIRLADDAFKLVYALACLPNYGTLRLVEAICYTASDANRGTLVLTRKQLMQALELVVGPEAAHLTKIADRVVAECAATSVAAAG